MGRAHLREKSAPLCSNKKILFARLEIPAFEKRSRLNKTARLKKTRLGGLLAVANLCIIYKHYYAYLHLFSYPG